MKCRSGKLATGLQHCVSVAAWALRSESKDCDVDFSAWNSCLCQGKLDIGGMGERLKPAVLKTAVRGTVPGVRIPLPPSESDHLPTVRAAGWMLRCACVCFQSLPTKPTVGSKIIPRSEGENVLQP